MTAYYNEIDPFAAQWLRNLIAAGHIAGGDVDERSVEDVLPSDLDGYARCHFFAGIGIWDYALRLAGWDADRDVWTGSCPCQPFSAAGKRAGTSDQRHLWPAWFHLIAAKQPATVFGEQVASKDGLGWFDLVSTDLEGAGYAVGAADLCAAGVGAPHIRQRLWFVAYASDQRRDGRRPGEAVGGQEQFERRGDDGLGHAAIEGPFPGTLAGVRGGEEGRGPRHGEPERPSANGGLGHAEGKRWERGQDNHDGGRGQLAPGHPGSGGLADAVQSGRTERWPFAGNGSTAGSFWSRAEWLRCTDGKARLAQRGIFPLAYGDTQRMGRLRAYGNAICPQVAKAFIEVAMEYAP